MFSFYHGEEVLHKLGCSQVAASDIMLKPALPKNQTAFHLQRLSFQLQIWLFNLQSGISCFNSPCLSKT
jgi:hypothetical protein